MKLKVEIALNNAAFAEYGGLEVSRILRDIALDFEYHPSLESRTNTIRDANGNTVGRWTVTE